MFDLLRCTVLVESVAQTFIRNCHSKSVIFRSKSISIAFFPYTSNRDVSERDGCCSCDDVPVHMSIFVWFKAGSVSNLEDDL